MQPSHVVLMIMNYIVIAGGKYPAKLSHEFERVPAREWHVEKARSQSLCFLVKKGRRAAGQQNVALNFRRQPAARFAKIFKQRHQPCFGAADAQYGKHV